MKFKEEEAVATANHSGETYYFCMQEHKETFVADPAKYLTKLDEPKHN